MQSLQDILGRRDDAGGAVRQSLRSSALLHMG